MSPTVSVIIPTYNRAHTLLRALNSVAQQTFSDWELILIDDASTDCTFETVQEWLQLKNFGERVLVKRFEKNLGVSAARNRGCKMATGRWLAFLDSDDEWLPDKLELQVSSKAAWIHGEELWIRNGVSVPVHKRYQKFSGEIFERCVDTCFVSPSATMVQREVFLLSGGFREDFPVCEDYDLWLRLSARYEIDLTAKPVVKKYGGHDDQLSRRLPAMDYYRAQALISILENGELTAATQLYVARVLLQKTEILIKGYQKYPNPDHLAEVSLWARKARTACQRAHSAADRRPLSDCNPTL